MDINASHYILGMVGLIIVGDKSSNFDAISRTAEGIQEKFAVNKNRFSDYLDRVK